MTSHGELTPLQNLEIHMRLHCEAYAIRENAACRQTWDPVGYRGENKSDVRENRIRQALALIEQRPVSSDTLAKRLGVQKHTINDYLRPYVVAGKIAKRRYGNKSMYSKVTE